MTIRNQSWRFAVGRLWQTSMLGRKIETKTFSLLVVMSLSMMVSYAGEFTAFGTHCNKGYEAMLEYKFSDALVYTI